MTKYEVNFTDNRTGAKSAIDVITAMGNITADDYISDCEKNSDDEWIDMLHSGTVELVPVYDEVLILMNDRCTKKEAERFLKNGTIIFDNVEEYISQADTEVTREDVIQGKITDVSVVKYGDHEYCIEYVR